MTPVFTVAQMREIDRKAINGNLTTGYSYMLKAGFGLFNAAKVMMSDRKTGEIAIVCGKGNNGGDGYVVGRLLLDAGYKVMCFSLCNVDTLTGEALVAFNEYVARKGNFLSLSDAGDLASLTNYSLIIDALLGTGLKGNPHGLWADAIEAINTSRVPILSVDTPSGLNNDTGVPANYCIKATTTVTMGFPKVGLFFYPGKEYVGELIIQDLSYPDEIVQSQNAGIYFPSIDKMRDLMPSRKPDGSKFDHGLAVLVCGSKGMTGSATMVANSALRTGCGMAHLAIPESSLPIVASKLTETVLHAIHETNDGAPSFSALEQIRSLAEKKQAICIGPGISHDSQTSRLVRELVKTVELPMVLDADGINAFNDNSDELKYHAGMLLITPHYGEWKRLFGELPSEPLQKIERIVAVAHEYRISVLYKNYPTIVADHEGSVFILPYGNSSLAKAGSGDVLSGIIVSLIAQGVSVTGAAMLGTYILGDTARIVSEEMGEYSVTATDLICSLYKTIKVLGNKKALFCKKCGTN